jgi:hypothetical protein
VLLVLFLFEIKNEVHELVIYTLLGIMRSQLVQGERAVIIGNLHFYTHTCTHETEVYVHVCLCIMALAFAAVAVSSSSGVARLSRLIS